MFQIDAMRNITFFIVWFLNSHITFSQELKYQMLLFSKLQTPDPDEIYKKEVGNMLKRADVATSTTKYFSDLAKFTYKNITAPKKNYRDALSEAYGDAGKFKNEFQNVINASRSKLDNEKIVFKSSTFTARLTLAPLESLPIWGPIQKEIDNQIFEGIENDINENHKRKLAYSLNILRIKNQKKYKEVIKSGNYEQVKKALEEVNYFANSDFSNTGPEFQELVERSQEKFLREAVKTTLKRAVSDINKIDFKVADIDKQLTGLAKFTYGYAEETNGRLLSLANAQNDLNEKLDKFYDQYKTDKKALDFMQEFMYSKMNGYEKLNALKSGLLSNLKSEERQLLVDQIELQVKKQEVINRAKEFFNSAQTAISIIDNLGLGDSKYMQDFSTAVHTGQAAFTAFESFSSGNYLQGVAVITGLFARKEDAATQRHKQIIGFLERIDQKLDRIEQKIDILLNAAQQMIDLQVETYNTIVKLSEKIDLQYIALTKNLNTIENALYVNRSLILNEWESKCQACLKTINMLNLNVDINAFPSDDLLKAKYPSLKDQEFKSCEEYITKYVFSIDKPTINPEFHLVSHIDDVDISNTFNTLDSFNNEALKFIKRSVEKDSDKNITRYIMSLYFPSYDYNSINRKYFSNEVEYNINYYPTDIELLIKVIKPDVSIRHGYVIRNIASLINLTDQDRQIISWKQFTSDDPPVHRENESNIKDAIRLNNVAIAQQNLLSGDMLLPIMYKSTLNRSKSREDSLLFEDVKRLLSLNTLLATNFLKYYIARYTSTQDFNLLMYSYLYDAKESENMTKSLNLPFQIKYLDSINLNVIDSTISLGWKIWITDEKTLDLPLPSDCLNPIISHTQFTGELFNNREKLMQSHINYSPLSPKNVRATNFLLLKETQIDFEN